MLQVRNGEVEMLGVLFDRYHAPLFNFYTKMTQNRTVSEDLVQDVFLRISALPPNLSSGHRFPNLDVPDRSQRPPRPCAQRTARGAARQLNRWRPCLPPIPRSRSRKRGCCNAR